ncbi:MAG: SDR family NAD(P)-dependent oxidoreductase [Pyrinomonadaceae bacterium]
MSTPLCVVVGFDPGVGLGIARAFGGAGFRLGLVARTPSKLTDVVRGLSDAGVDVSFIAADASDESSVTEAIHRASISTPANITASS